MMVVDRVTGTGSKTVVNEARSVTGSSLPICCFYTVSEKPGKQRNIICMYDGPTFP